MIIFENVTRRYGKTTVLDRINFSIEAGEFVCLIGPSGAGKSTLIHALIGAENIQHGSISVDGYVINKLKADALQYYRRRLGVVFQDCKLLPKKNVYENVAFAMEVCGYGNLDIKKRVNEALALTGLQEHKRHFPQQLSGGQCQKVSIARALVHNPSLIVADEPTGNLDPQAAHEIINLLLKLNHDGITVLLATHNPVLVNHVRRRVIKLENGRVVSDKANSGYA